MRLTRLPRVLAMVYARHGRELMGCKSPVQRIQSLSRDRVNQVLAEGKGVSARRGLKIPLPLSINHVEAWIEWLVVFDNSEDDMHQFPHACACDDKAIFRFCLKTVV